MWSKKGLSRFVRQQQRMTKTLEMKREQKMNFPSIDRKIVCELERERSVCVRACVRERENECVFMCVCVCVRERERERGRKRKEQSNSFSDSSSNPLFLWAFNYVAFYQSPAALAIIAAASCAASRAPRLNLQRFCPL